MSLKAINFGSLEKMNIEIIIYKSKNLTLRPFEIADKFVSRFSLEKVF